MSGNATINLYLDNGQMDSIYIHWDGYIDSVGRILEESYQNKEKIQALINRGSASSLEKEIEYMNFYEDDNTPRRLSSENFFHSPYRQEFNYLWFSVDPKVWIDGCYRDGYWIVSHGNDSQWYYLHHLIKAQVGQNAFS